MLFFAHDYETTGVNARSCGVVQLAHCEVHLNEDGTYKILDSFKQLLNPGMPIPEGASKIHGIYDKDVARSPNYETFLSAVFEEFSAQEYLGVIGYNSKSYDDVIARRFGMPAAMPLDLYVAARRLKNKGLIGSAKLSSVYEQLLDEPAENAHDAMADIIMTLDIIKPVMALLEVSTVSELASQLNVAKVNKTMKMPYGKYKGKPLCNLPKSYLRWLRDNTDLTGDLKASIEAVL